ncbi:hypothetical protein O181_081222 [Austropuccinia psidii MF-1]|uniref:Uncharacterized protein n=1 Tax=Austropuccinia psidii MF-1 TaxID=1389203 RepID=A0A9Q3FN64_9BASI|nr:hypothetical protein [Austropuccinia psidii MF-1]
MSSKLTSIYDSNKSDFKPSVIYGPSVFDSWRELSEESMGPKELYEIKKTYNLLKSARVISQPASIVRRMKFLVLNLLLLGPTGSNYETLEKEAALWTTIDSKNIPEDYRVASRRVEYLDWKLVLMNPQPLMPLLIALIVVTGSRIRGVKKWNSTTSSWANIGGHIHSQGNPIGVDPEVPILGTSKDGRLGKLKRNLVFQD